MVAQVCALVKSRYIENGHPTFNKDVLIRSIEKPILNLCKARLMSETLPIWKTCFDLFFFTVKPPFLQRFTFHPKTNFRRAKSMAMGNWRRWKSSASSWCPILCPIFCYRLKQLFLQRKCHLKNEIRKIHQQTICMEYRIWMGYPNGPKIFNKNNGQTNSCFIPWAPQTYFFRGVYGK